MTELTEGPLFKVGVCIGEYIQINKRGVPDSVLISERNHNYLEGLFYTEMDGVACLHNSAGATLRIRRIEELSRRKRQRLEAVKGTPLYLCQTGFWGRIKTRSIHSYNLDDVTYNLHQQ